MKRKTCSFRKQTFVPYVMGGLLVSAAPAFADTEIDALKKELADQKRLIQQLLTTREDQKPSDAKGEATRATPTTAIPGITFYGTADVNVARMNSGFGSKTSFGTGGMTASSIGVKGERELGSGLKVVGEVEAGVALDTGVVSNGAVVPGINNTVPSSGGLVGSGPQIFSRQAYAGLATNVGTFTIGRQYTGSYVAAAAFGNALGAGFLGNGATFLPVIGGMPTRVNNSFVYKTPRVSGFSGHFTYTTGSENNVSNNFAIGAVTTSDKAGQGWDLGLLYLNGPLTASLTTWNVNNASFVTAGENGLAEKKGWQIVGNYNFGFMRLYGAFVSGKISGGNYENVTRVLSKASGASASAAIPFGKSTVYISYASLNDKSLLDRDGSLLGVAYKYELFKNTNLYASWGRQTNKDNAAYSLATGGDLVGNVSTPGFDPSGFVVGLNIKF